MTKRRSLGLGIIAAALLAPISVVKSQAPADDAGGDLADSIFATLAARGPVNSDELGAAVRANLAQGLDEQAAELIASYLDPSQRSSVLPGEESSVEASMACAYCVRQLASPAPDRELEAVLAALDVLERKARATSDGNLLVALASTFEDVDTSSAHGLSLSYLLDGLAVGNLQDSNKMLAVRMLERRGWYEAGKALIEQMLSGGSSVDAETLQAWVVYFDNLLLSESELKARLVSDVVGAAREYVPVYKVAQYYPQAAAGEHGSVIVQYTVTEAGRTADIEIIESSNAVFNEPAVWAAKQFRYAPRIVGGLPVAVERVRNRISFQPPQSH